MINTKFEAFKIKRQLEKSGKEFQFKRPLNNSYGEESDQEPIDVCKIIGIYHEQSSNIQIITGETTQYRTKKIPMILTKYSSELLLIKPNDIVHYNNKKYRVQGMMNYLELNIIVDISLEVIDDGSNF